MNLSDFKMIYKLIEVLPKLRNQFGFIGLIVMVGAFVAVRKVAPDALPAQVTAGSIGVIIIIFGQIFYYLRLIPEGQRALFVIVMFAIFCVFMLSLMAFTAYKVIKSETKIDQVSIQGYYKGRLVSANTLDDLKIRWSHEGKDGKFEIVLREIISEKFSDNFTVQASDHNLLIPASRLKRLWPDPKLDEVFSIRVEFQGKNKVLRFGPFDVKTAIRIIYFVDSNKLTVAALADEQNLIPHSFEARVIAWPEESSGPESLPESVDIKAPSGKGYGEFPEGFNPDVMHMNCVYFGRYPSELVRYKNMHID